LAILVPALPCIAGYALSWVIHRIQSEIYFGNPDWYLEGLWPEKPPFLFLWQPPARGPGRDRVWKWRSDNLTVTVSLVYLAASEQTVLPGFGFAFALWISAHGHGIITYHYNLSSSSKNFTTCFNPAVWR
jgi:hypothetical protein